MGGILQSLSGSKKKIDHRSYKRQGVDIEPQIHVGYSSKKAKINAEIIKLRDRVKSLIENLKALENEIKALENKPKELTAKEIIQIASKQERVQEWQIKNQYAFEVRNILSESVRKAVVEKEVPAKFGSGYNKEWGTHFGDTFKRSGEKIKENGEFTDHEKTIMLDILDAVHQDLSRFYDDDEIIDWRVSSGSRDRLEKNITKSLINYIDYPKEILEDIEQKEQQRQVELEEELDW